MKSRILAALLFALFAPVSQASVISIGDPFSGLDGDETITLLVNRADITTSVGQLPPGGGDVIDTTLVNDPAHGLSGINCPVVEQANPTCAFTFADHAPWNSNVYIYRYFTELGGGLSDLFVIQGRGGTNPDIVTFISNDNLTGNPLDWVQNLTGANPVNLGNVAENGQWQLAMDTGVDQYYVRSAVPEPATLALLAVGLAGLGFSRRKQ